jgi:hypothetical protein
VSLSRPRVGSTISSLKQQALDENKDLILGPTDRRALTPLTYAHVNPYGTFKLDLNTRLALT